MVLLVLTFVLALALSFAILMLATRHAATSRSFQQRLITIRQPARATQADSDAAQLEGLAQRNYAARFGDFLKHYKFSRRIETLLLHADSSLNVGSAVLISVGAAIACALAVFFFVKIPALAALAFFVGGAVPFIVLKIQRARRLKAFNTALPDAIELMARTLRAGHSVASSIEIIGEQSPEPLGGEFSHVYQQQKFGLRFRDALLRMGDRVPSRDLQFLITAILVQKETGGELTEILDRTAYVIHERIRIEGEVRTRTAQGRLTGWILGLLPVIMLALLNIVSPGYSSLLFHDPTGKKLLYTGAVLILVGAAVIRKVVDVQV